MSLLIWVFPFLVLFLPQNAIAYNDYAHQQIVITAFEYILTAPDNLTYVDQSTSASDRKLLRQAFAGSGDSPDEAAAKIRDAGKRFATYTVQADYKPDIWLQYCLVGLCTGGGTDKLGVFYTVFAHFLNVHGGQDTIWPYRGYAFRYVEQNTACENDGASDIGANEFAGSSSYHFVRQRSQAYTRFIDPHLSTVTIPAIEQHFDLPLRDLHFWPITTLAGYWYREYQKGDDASLGPVLHAMADTTVPFHAVGLSGCGHTPYEAGADTFVKETPYDRSIVENLLQRDGSLNSQKAIDELLLSNAEQAAAKCVHSGQSSNCPFYKKVDEKNLAYRELVNRAVAATTVMIRKALSEGRRAHSVASLFADDTVIESPKAEQGYNSWTEVKVQPPRLHGSNNLIEESLNPELFTSTEQMKQLIAILLDQKISASKFHTAFELSIMSIAGIVKGNPTAELQPSEPLTLKVRYRDPTKEENNNQHLWTRYLNESRKFYGAVELFTLGQELAVLESRHHGGKTFADQYDLEDAINERQMKVRQLVRKLTYP